LIKVLRNTVRTRIPLVRRDPRQRLHRVQRFRRRNPRTPVFQQEN
jgi:hypothetical protein